MKPGKPASVRRTAVQSPGEIGRRLAGLLYVLTGAAGVILMIAGLAQGRSRWTIAGVGLFAIWLILHCFARRLRLKEPADEIRQNPFKPSRSADVGADRPSTGDSR